jgi:hypothetical protein
LDPSVTITFDPLIDAPGTGTASVERVLVTSGQDELDYSLLLLDRWPGATPGANLAPQDPRVGEPVFVLGYPLGGGLAISLGNTEVVETTGSRQTIRRDQDVLMYRAATQSGSSGSPVFNENWELVAIHMGPSPEARANYGLSFRAAVADASRRLEEVVLEEDLLDRIRADSLARDERPRFSSVFISYSHADETFADRLYNALRANGVPAWYDKQNILPGFDLYDEVSKGMQRQDKILFCCSRAAAESGWVDAEVDRALQKERELFRAGRASAQTLPRVKPLIPVDLDGYLIDGSWQSGKAPELQSRGIADFRGWETQVQFEKAFERLIRSLRKDVETSDR